MKSDEIIRVFSTLDKIARLHGKNADRQPRCSSGSNLEPEELIGIACEESAC